jgi:hypothetical protein
MIRRQSMKVPLLHDITVWLSRYVHEQWANEFSNYLATRFGECWCCGIAPPLVELAHRLPEGAVVQVPPRRSPFL